MGEREGRERRRTTAPTERERKVTWCFTSSQPVWLYQGECAHTRQEKTAPGSLHRVQTLLQGTHTHIGTNGVKLKAEVRSTCIKNKNYNDFFHYNCFFQAL